MSGKFTRKNFLSGTVAGLGAIGLLGSAQQASAATKAPDLPPGFSYAPGEPPAVDPVRTVRGVITAVDSSSIQVQTGTDLETVPLADGKPFIWDNGLVPPHLATKRLAVGSPVTLDGVTDESGVFTEIQHVWVTDAF